MRVIDLKKIHNGGGGGARTHDLRIMIPSLWPAELPCHCIFFLLFWSVCKCQEFFGVPKSALFCTFVKLDAVVAKEVLTRKSIDKALLLLVIYRIILLHFVPFIYYKYRDNIRIWWRYYCAYKARSLNHNSNDLFVILIFCFIVTNINNDKKYFIR